MPLFTYEQIKGMNPGEFRVYNFIMSHLPAAHGMNIRQLAGAVGVSTTTVLRFCEKVGCSGYTELKYRLKQQAGLQEGEGSYDAVPAVQFIRNSAEDGVCTGKLAQAAEIFANADLVVLYGDGGSGMLARYGAYLLNGTGKAAFPAENGYGTACPWGSHKTALLILSSRGDSEETISIMDSYKKAGASLVSITNAGHCTAAQISDINFACYMPEACRASRDSQPESASQLPVVYLLERLAAELQNFPRQTADEK